MPSIDEVGSETTFPDDVDDITFDDAPAQVRPVVVNNTVINAPKARKTRKPRKLTVAKTAKKQHRVDTIDKNHIVAYLDKLVNEEGYTILSVNGSNSMMGAFDILSVKG